MIKSDKAGGDDKHHCSGDEAVVATLGISFIGPGCAFETVRIDDPVNADSTSDSKDILNTKAHE